MRLSHSLSRVLLIGVLLVCHAIHAQSARDGFDPNVDGTVHAIARFDDGKLLIGGDFTSVGGVFQTRLARLNPDGSRDTSFGNPVTGGSVRVIHIAPNGDVLIGGENLSVTDIAIPMGALFRFKADGSIDLAFKPVSSGRVDAIVDDGADGFYLGGTFTSVAGQPNAFFARINALGSSISGNLLGVNAPLHSLVRDAASGAIFLGGEFTQLGGLPVNRIARLRSDNVRDTRFTPDINGSVLALTLARNGDLLVGGEFTQVNGATRLNFVRLTERGAINTDYPERGIDNRVRAVVERGDGDIVIAGDFTRVNNKSHKRIIQLDENSTRSAVLGGTDAPIHALLLLSGDHLVFGGEFTDAGGFARNRLARTDGHGIMDETLDTAINGIVTTVVRLPSHQWLIGGDFTQFDNATRTGLALMNSTGAVITPLSGTADAQLNGVPLAMAALPSGEIVIAGEFNSAYNAGAGYVIRTNGDASQRSPFANFSADANATVRALAVQPDGKIFIGGDFSQVGGVNRAGIARLNTNGTLDTTFNALLNGGAVVRAIALQRDGKVVIGGTFSSASGTLRNHLVRVNGAGGVLDTAFNPNPNARVDTLVLQPDGDILVGGEFTTLGATSRVRVARLNSDGSVDSDFNASLSSASVARVSALAVQADGRVLIGGSNGLITRRLATGATDPTFAVTSNGSILGIHLGIDGKIVLNGSFAGMAGQAREGLARIVASDRDAGIAFAYNSTLGSVLWGVRDSAAQVIGTPVLSVSSDDGLNFEVVGEMTRISSLWRIAVDPPGTQPLLYKIEASVAGGSAGSSVSRVATVHELRLPAGLFADGFD
ncbi:MAG: delta-60 repeat domain-containing protein [Lysobacteraceae bacterium]